MNRLVLGAVGTLFAGALLTAVACSSDSNGDGGGGSTTTGSGGSCPCYSCADFTVACINECPPGDPRDLVCPNSLIVLNALNECVCDSTRGGCGEECPGTCSMTIGDAGSAGAGGIPPDTADCIPCQGEAITDVCKTEWDACSAARDCS